MTTGHEARASKRFITAAKNCTSVGELEHLNLGDNQAIRGMSQSPRKIFA
jgi:hypothetical protein